MTRLFTIIGLVGLAAALSFPPDNTDLNAAEPDDHADFGPWSTPVNLGPVVNSAAGDAGPTISKDGLSLYLQSSRHTTAMETDLFVSRRAARDLPWGTPERLGLGVNSNLSEVTPFLSRDGHLLFFGSIRAGNFELYVSRRRHKRDDFSWDAPTGLPSPVSGPSFDVGPAYVELGGRPQLYFSSDRAGGGGNSGLDIYVTELHEDCTWTGPQFVFEINSAAQDGRPAIRFDGLEVIFNSSRGGNNDLYVSRRDQIWEAWSTPVPVSEANSQSEDIQPTLSGDGRTLYFASLRALDNRGLDLYVSTRSKRGHHAEED
jgi:hypothetical protein